MTKYGYIRVSTEKQEYIRQQLPLKEYGVEECNIYEETISGTKKATDRPEFDRMVQAVVPGDVCVFESMSRMARSMQDLIYTTNYLVKDKKVKVVFIKENLTIGGEGSESAMSQLVFNIMGAFAQFERDMLSDRTKQGLRARKELLGDDFKCGHPKTEISSYTIAKVLDLYKKGFSKLSISKNLSLGRKIVDRILKENLNVV